MAEGRDRAAMGRFIERARHAVLATTSPTGEPRLVPICFVVAEEAEEPAVPAGSPERFVLYSALDEKPKRAADPLALARVRDLRERPEASLLIDRWSEDWDQLGWVRLRCRGEVVLPNGSDAFPGGSAIGRANTDEHDRAVAALREKYPQYRDQRLESRPLIRLICSVAAAWGAIDEAPRRPEEANP